MRRRKPTGGSCSSVPTTPKPSRVWNASRDRASCDVSGGCSLRDLFNRGPADGSWLVSKPTYNRQGGAPDERPQSSTNLPGKSSPSGAAGPRTSLVSGRGSSGQRDQRADGVQVAGPSARRRGGWPAGPQFAAAAQSARHAGGAAGGAPRVAPGAAARTP